MCLSVCLAPGHIIWLNGGVLVQLYGVCMRMYEMCFFVCFASELELFTWQANHLKPYRGSFNLTYVD